MSETYVPEHGYTVGPTLPLGEDPWPLMWEQRVGNDDCAHQWERVVIQRRFLGTEPVVRCAVCHAPRCGHSDDPDPCMERRHHRDLHIYLSGEFEPVGGILRCHVKGCRHTAKMCPKHATAPPPPPPATPTSPRRGEHERPAIGC